MIKESCGQARGRGKINWLLLNDVVGKGKSKSIKGISHLVSGVSFLFRRHFVSEASKENPFLLNNVVVGFERGLVTCYSSSLIDW